MKELLSFLLSFVIYTLRTPHPFLYVIQFRLVGWHLEGWILKFACEWL